MVGIRLPPYYGGYTPPSLLWWLLPLTIRSLVTPSHHPIVVPLLPSDRCSASPIRSLLIMLGYPIVVDHARLSDRCESYPAIRSLGELSGHPIVAVNVSPGYPIVAVNVSPGYPIG